MRIIAIVLSAVLAGCTEVAVAPRTAPLDLSLTRDCDAPVTVPVRDLTGREVASMWGRDRLALRDCGTRHHATVEIIERRDRSLSGR